MMHKGWSSIKEVPYCFSRSSVKFQGHTGQKSSILNSSLNLLMAMKWCTKLEVTQKSYPITFQGHPSNFKVTRDKKNCRFWPDLSDSGLQLQFEFSDGYEMMHKAWCSKEEVLYCFQGHPSNFKVMREKKFPISTWIERFRTVTPV